MDNRYLTDFVKRLARDFGEPEVIWQAAVLIGLLVVAYWCARLLRGRALRRRKSQQGALSAARHGVRDDRASGAGAAHPHGVLRLALVPLCGITVIYMMFYVARRVFSRDKSEHEAGALLYLFEKIVTVIVWVTMLLTVMGAFRTTSCTGWAACASISRCAHDAALARLGRAVGVRDADRCDVGPARCSTSA